MQLFLTDFVLQGDGITIANPTVLEQMKKVLRMKKGDVIAVQAVQSRKYKVQKEDVVRYVMRVDDRDHERVYGTVLEKILAPGDGSPLVTMYVAFPNKRDKAELIVQKLAELGVARIVFWVAERSVLRQANDNKVSRLYKIIHEAVEQSWGWSVPSLEFVLDTNFVVEERVVIFDIEDKVESTKYKVQSDCFVGVVGPEGGLTESDYVHFPHHVVSCLGNTILRMETAAIVGAYELQVQSTKYKGAKFME